MTSKYLIDPATGLPEVGPNRFWRVLSEYHYDFGFYVGDKVQLIEVSTKLTRWLKKEIRVEHVLATARIYDGTTKKNILTAANEALEDYQSREVRKSLLGDYPPKSVNN